MKVILLLILLALVGCMTSPAPMKKEVPIGEMGATVRGHSEESKETNP